MHPCSLHELANRLLRESSSKSIGVALSKQELSQLSVLKHTLYDLEHDEQMLSARPWRNLPRYFTQVLISSLALVKMSIHAKLGGSIEVMGMLTGKIVNNAIVVMDVYSLPVEGTETRVNAQNEAYEYMVQYLDLLKSVGRVENIVGWYHSHPGYGCWLSGIDVATQSLNQNFQDPYLAIVVDPIQSLNQGKVEIGAFRTFPIGYAPEKNLIAPENVPIKSKSKKQDFGAHADQYYPLDIKLFKNPEDEALIDSILSKSWVTNLLLAECMAADYDKKLTRKIEELLVLKTCATPQQHPNDPARHHAMARFNLMFEQLIGKTVRQKECWDTQRDKPEPMDEFSRGNSVSRDDQEDDQDDDDDDEEDDEDDDDDMDAGDKGDDVEMVTLMRGEEDAKGKKRYLRTSSEDSKSSIYFESRRVRMRTLFNVDKQKVHAMQTEIKKHRREVTSVGHAELMNLMVSRARRQVFGPSDVHTHA